MVDDGGISLDFFGKDRKGDLTWSMKQTPVLGPHGAPSKGLIGFKRQSHAHRPRTHTADAGCMNRLDGKTSSLFAFIACHGPILCRMNLGLWRACSSWQQWMVWFCCVFLSKPRKSPRACLRKARIQSLLVPCAQAFPLRGYGNQSSYCWKTCWHATSMASKSRPASVCQEKCKCMLMWCLSSFHHPIVTLSCLLSSREALRRGPNMITSCKLEAPWIASSIPCWWLAMGTCCCAWQDHGGYFELVLLYI